MKPPSKADFARQLAEAVEQYQAAGGEIVRYASPSNPTPIKLGAKAVPVANLREDEWRKFVAELEAGTYTPESEYQEPVKRLKRRPAGSDFRGWKNVKGRGPMWRD